MTTDEKLQSFYDSTIQAASEEAEQIVTDYQKALDTLYEEHVESVRRRGARELADEKEKLKRDTNKAISAEQLEIRKRQSLQAREMKKHIFDDVEAKLRAFKESPDYLPYLEQKVKESLKQIPCDKHEKMIFFLDPSDAALAGKLSRKTWTKVEISEESFIGGLQAVIRERHIMIDNSFASMLREEKELFTLEGGLTNV